MSANNNFFISSGAKEAVYERFDSDSEHLDFDLDAGDDGILMVTVTVYRNYALLAGAPTSEVHGPMNLIAFAEYMNAEVD